MPRRGKRGIFLKIRTDPRIHRNARRAVRGVPRKFCPLQQLSADREWLLRYGERDSRYHYVLRGSPAVPEKQRTARPRRFFARGVFCPVPDRAPGGRLRRDLLLLALRDRKRAQNGKASLSEGPDPFGCRRLSHDGKLGEKALLLPEYIDKTVNELKSIETGVLYTCHCTGLTAYGIMKQALGDRIQYLQTGEELEF